MYGMKFCRRRLAMAEVMYKRVLLKISGEALDWTLM